MLFYPISAVVAFQTRLLSLSYKLHKDDVCGTRYNPSYMKLLIMGGHGDGQLHRYACVYDKTGA